jgi:endonuclease III
MWWRSGTFEILRQYTIPAIAWRLKKCGIGCQTMKAGALSGAAWSDLDLRTCTAEDLEKIPGIGRKTSRFFLLHSRKNADCACLDVHILRWLQEQGVETTDRTPSSAKEYRRLEQEFLSRVPAGKSVAEFDLEIWTEKSRKVNV